MAEAHNAVAFQFAVSDEGVVVNLNKEIIKLMLNSMYKSVKRRCNDAKNAFLKGVYPASPATWMFFLAALLAARYSEHRPTIDILQRMEADFPVKHRFERSTILAICIFVIVTIVWLFSAYFCQFILKRLLGSYSILYNARRKLTIANKLWLAMVKLLCGFSPGLFSFQNSLPSQPVPPLEDTLSRHLDSVRPIMNDEEYNNLVKLTDEFKNTVGPKLQRYLKLKYFWSPNYVSDWWERFIYLRSRASLMLNSNYYAVGPLHGCNSNNQAARAATMIHCLFRYRKHIDKHLLKPLKLFYVYPLCSSQYTRNFNSTRVPGKEEDVITTVPESNYVVVFHKGCFFKVTVVFGGDLIQPIDIQIKLKQIIEYDGKQPGRNEDIIGYLTAAERGVWADARNKYFGTGLNKESLDIIEKSAFFVALDDNESSYTKWSETEEAQTKLNEFGQATIHGKGYDRWFDKSFNLVVLKNGQAGFNAEHTWADAPILAQMWEWIHVEEIENYGYDESGNCTGKPRFDWPLPKKLSWDLPEEVHTIIDEIKPKIHQQIDDLDLYIKIFTNFGKGDIKKMKVSPDAFVQMAFQLAYYKTYKKVCLTYESAMTRLFKEGRTETVRSCSIASTNFAKAAADPNVPVEEKRDLLKKACDYHIDTCRSAMTGDGVDRHLFALYVVSQYLKLEVPFLKTVLSEPWVLSTSQTAVNQTMRLNLQKYPERTCAGGGFGPVAEKGYGLSYIINGENLISLHVSSKKSCSHTNSETFANLICETMIEMRGYMLER